MNPNEYSLREVKHARTKIALMKAFIEHLRHASFENVSIKDVCRRAEISEGTFFNYFPEKIAVVTYYVNLMTIKLIWKVRQKDFQGRNIFLINAFFEEMAAEFSVINIKYELISIMLIQRAKPQKTAISAVEKQIFFPDLAGIEAIEAILPEEFFRECLAAALKNGELPEKVDLANVLISLKTIMVGAMIAIKFSDVRSLKDQYMRQLAMLWRDVGAKQAKG